MHLFDILFLGLAGALIVLGIWRGLITEAFRLLAVFLGFVTAVRTYDDVYARIDFLSLASGVKVVLAFLVVFVGTAAVVLVVGWLLRKMVHLTLLGWVDRLGGGCIGLAKTFVVAWAVSLMLEALPAPKLHTSLQESFVYAACAQLPTRLRLPGMDSTRESIDEMVSDETLSKFPERLDRFRSRIDSAKHRNDGERR